MNAPSSLLRTLTTQVPPKLFRTYVAVGIVNTLFSYGAFSLLTFALTPHVPGAYVFASIISNLLSISFSYLTYKLFVFKTKGNYVREWLRCIAVYSGSSILGTALLAPLVFLLRRIPRVYDAAPYIAGGVIAGTSVVFGFIGHKNFTFRTVPQKKRGD
jgi:putative flippase GtrA